jgi:hypothetical protein
MTGNIRLGCMRFTVTNTLVYYVTAVKSFIVQSPGNFSHFWLSNFITRLLKRISRSYEIGFQGFGSVTFGRGII